MQSKRVTEIIHWFGLDHCKAQEEIDMEIPPPAGGQIILLNGPSGAGKSRLMARIKNEWEKRRNGESAIGQWLDLADLELPDGAVVDCFPQVTLEETLLGLNRVGLAEAWDYIRPPAALSEGQKFRLRLAMGLAACGGMKGRNGETERGRIGEAEKRRMGDGTKPQGNLCSDSPVLPLSDSSAPTVLACDEFCAILDRITARVVARTLRRTLDHQKNVCAIVATSHDDLVEALMPDVLVRCDFGKAEVWQGRND